MKPETRIQIDLVEWIRKEYPNLLFTSTQAGDVRSGLKAIMMKRMGYTNGTPDLIIFTARKGFNGLLLELKTEFGMWSTTQREFCSKAEGEGYKYFVAYGLDQAKEAVKKYISPV